MKNIVLSAVAVLAMSSFSVADIAPVEEPIVVVEEPVVSTGGFYLGLAYGFMNAEVVDQFNNDHVEITETILDEDFSSIMINAGYGFNQYVGIEGRYWFGLSTNTALGRGDFNSDVTVDAWGIYVKPMYPVSEVFNFYALLGYAGADLTVDKPGYTLTSDSVDGFSWGVGAEYRFTDAVGLFADFVMVCDSDEDYVNANGFDIYNKQEIKAINVGVNYRF